ncbi:hypothetical protein UlMin_003485 [Ulmus minor]
MYLCWIFRCVGLSMRVPIFKDEFQLIGVFFFSFLNLNNILIQIMVKTFFKSRFKYYYYIKENYYLTSLNLYDLFLTMEIFSQRVSGLPKTLAEVLAQNLGLKPTYLKESCPPYLGYLRLNRYPPSPYPSKQDQVGGLQLLKDGRWLSVKTSPEALVINIGDLFQALSNGVYKSFKHRVVRAQVERFLAAYFLCPSNDTIIEKYKRRVDRDVQETGDKMRLERFLPCKD